MEYTIDHFNVLWCFKYLFIYQT